jgi:hypothetical protein
MKSTIESDTVLRVLAYCYEDTDLDRGEYHLVWDTAEKIPTKEDIYDDIHSLIAKSDSTQIVHFLLIDEENVSKDSDVYDRVNHYINTIQRQEKPLLLE